jgi:hypothetical protein
MKFPEESCVSSYNPYTAREIFQLKPLKGPAHSCALSDIRSWRRFMAAQPARGREIFAWVTEARAVDACFSFWE